ncbi:MAG TPA: hypothetical protein VF541_06545 [Longimicrobium sp.]|jgi:hypothetical protein
MRKLELDALTVDSFATTTQAIRARTTGSPACPVSYGGTCVITCTGCITNVC